MSNFHEAKVLTVHHWTDRQFSFTTTRDPGFRFQSGQFTMIGLNAVSYTHLTLPTICSV